MPAILANNPNTAASIVDLVAGNLRNAVAVDVERRTVTGRFGARHFSANADGSIAGHPAMQVDAECAEGIDAACLACLGDSELFALRGCATVQVIGPARFSRD